MGHKMALSVVNVLISQTAHFVCLSGLMRPQVPWARAQKSMQYYPNSTLIRTGHMLCVWSMQIYAETNLINASRVPAQTNDKLPLGKPTTTPLYSFFLPLTRLHLILQRCGAILDQLLQWQRPIRHFQVQQTLHILGMMKVQDLFIAIVRCLDKVQQDIDNLQQKFTCLRARTHCGGHEICDK